MWGRVCVIVIVAMDPTLGDFLTPKTDPSFILTPETLPPPESVLHLALLPLDVLCYLSSAVSCFVLATRPRSILAQNPSIVMKAITPSGASEASFVFGCNRNYNDCHLWFPCRVWATRRRSTRRRWSTTASKTSFDTRAIWVSF